MLAIMNQIKRYEETLQDNNMNVNILLSLIPKFDYVICVIESKYLDCMAVDQVMTELQDQ